jgi:hypothetical protein
MLITAVSRAMPVPQTDSSHEPKPMTQFLTSKLLISYMYSECIKAKLAYYNASPNHLYSKINYRSLAS